MKSGGTRPPAAWSPATKQRVLQGDCRRSGDAAHSAWHDPQRPSGCRAKHQGQSERVGAGATRLGLENQRLALLSTGIDKAGDKIGVAGARWSVYGDDASVYGTRAKDLPTNLFELVRMCRVNQQTTQSETRKTLRDAGRNAEQESSRVTRGESRRNWGVA